MRNPDPCLAGLLIDTMTSKSKQTLPLPHILQDLALLRASGYELFKASPSSGVTPSSTSVELSYSYTVTVRAALKLNDSGRLEAEATRIEDIRNKYEELDVILPAFLVQVKAYESPYRA